MGYVLGFVMDILGFNNYKYASLMLLYYENLENFRVEDINKGLEFLENLLSYL